MLNHFLPRITDTITTINNTHMARSLNSLELGEYKQEEDCETPLLSSSLLPNNDDIGIHVVRKKDEATTLQHHDKSSDNEDEIDWSDEWKRLQLKDQFTYGDFRSIGENQRKIEFPPDRKLSYYRYVCFSTVVHSFISFMFLWDLVLASWLMIFPLMIFHIYEVISFRRDGPINILDRKIKFHSFLFGNDSNQVCSIILLKGDVYERMLGEPKQAAVCLQRVLEILMSRNSRSNHRIDLYKDNNYDDWRLAPFQSKLGLIFVRAKMYNEALGPLIESVRLYKEGIRMSEAGAAENIVADAKVFSAIQRKLPIGMHDVGFVLERLGQYNEAVKYHREAVSFIRARSETSGETLDTARGFKSLGRAFDLAGDTEGALEAFRSAVSVYRINYGGDCSDKGGNEVFRSISLGRIHVALGNIIWNKSGEK